MQAKTDVGFAQWSNATTYNIRLVIPAGGLLSFSQSHYCTIRSIISEYILHQLPRIIRPKDHRATIQKSMHYLEQSHMYAHCMS